MDNCKKIVSDGNRLLSTSPVEVLKSSVTKSHSNGLSTVLVAHFDGKVCILCRSSLLLAHRYIQAGAIYLYCTRLVGDIYIFRSLTLLILEILVS